MKCFRSAEILLPDFSKTDAKKWSVVACDQFTSEPAYWNRVEEFVGDAPSTLRMILPEVWLEQTEERVPQINGVMKSYLQEVLQVHDDAMIYVERTQSDGTVRRGIVMAVDLECYDYHKGSDSLIRATEATVLERIPPRVAIRRDADIELPHVMLLIDDPQKTVIEPLIGNACGAVAYDFDLMEKGGAIRGCFLTSAEQARVSDALVALVAPQKMAERYGASDLAPLLFAVGDGNHSLASAKAAYEERKAVIGADAAATHPSRYALVEVVNIHDDALKFEPIYRVMFHVDAADVLASLKAYEEALGGDGEEQKMTYYTKDTQGAFAFRHPSQQLTVGTLQIFIDDYLAKHPEASVDYIHGEDSVMALSAQENAIGFLFDGMQKDQLFATVIFDGALPRKTFSMGHATDKRYYLECRKIK